MRSTTVTERAERLCTGWCHIAFDAATRQEESKHSPNDSAPTATGSSPNPASPATDSTKARWPIRSKSWPNNLLYILFFGERAGTVLFVNKENQKNFRKCFALLSHPGYKVLRLLLVWGFLGAAR